MKLDKYSLASKIIYENWTLKKVATFSKISISKVKKTLREVLHEMEAEVEELKNDIDTLSEALKK